jgi:hypothetical protein
LGSYCERKPLPPATLPASWAISISPVSEQQVRALVDLMLL